MAEVIRMPKMSDTMEEGVIAAWLKKEGDEVSSGDVLAEVETDKATMELESYQDGVLLYIGVKEKDAVPVDGILAVIGEKGEEFQHLLTDAPAPVAEAAPVADAQPTEIIDTSNINAVVLKMPKMSDTMTEGVIASWLKKVGDEIASGDILAEVETDKATMELESYDEGTLLYTAVEAGGSVPVDAVIAIVGEKGADFETLLKAETQPKQTAVKEVAETKPVATPSPTSSTNTSSSSDNGRIKASPLAKKMAQEKGYDLSQITGTGEGGRIIKRDVEAFTPSASTSSATPSAFTTAVIGEEKSDKLNVSQMRKSIAKRLSGSKFSAPHFYLTMEINMDKAIEARKSLNEIAPVKISFNDMVVKATAAALRQHPQVNVSWMDDYMLQHHHINIGVAVAIPDGLIVPVVRFADNKSLSQLSAEIKELGGKAKDKKLQPEEFSGGTFTISNLGMFGIEEFTAIINPPEACILAVGGIKQTAVVKDGQLVPGNVMKVTLSCDHRVVDGAVGSAFLKTLKGLLEDPVRILL